MSSRELLQTSSITRAIACVDAVDANFSVLDQWADITRYRRATNILITFSDVFHIRALGVYLVVAKAQLSEEETVP
jgi:hypothetical protein